MTYYFLGLCKELVVFRVWSNSSNHIHNFLSLFWGCSVAWPSLVVRGHATPVRSSDSYRIKNESPGSPINYVKNHPSEMGGMISSASLSGGF